MNTELALRKSEALANQIIENAPDPMLLVDANGCILRLNARVEAVFGYAQSELLGQAVEILIPDALREQHRRQHRKEYAHHPETKAMGTGRQFAARHKDGSELFVEISLAPLESGDALQVIVILRDVTERRKVDAALADRNAQLATLFQLSPDGLVSFNRAGRVKFVNPAFLRMTGLLAAEVVGQPLGELERRLRELAETPEQWPGLAACFPSQEVGADGTAAGGQGPRRLLALRRPRTAVLDIRGVHSDAASVSRLLYVRDVTHEVEVDRMKSEFLSHAAHELRTPMASIYGFSELLISREFDAATRHDLLTSIHKQTAWLIEIINELLDLTRIEERRGKDFMIEAVPLPPLVGEGVAAMQIDPARWPLSVAITDDLPPARADAAKLRQALTNVLGNAVKYSPAGGAIEVRGVTRVVDRQPQVGIAVTDHGIGMTPDQAARVGERFYRADTSGNIPGTGLGMSIAKEIVELLGGQVDIGSKVGAGTTVTLWLPAASVDGEHPARPLSPESFQEHKP